MQDMTAFIDYCHQQYERQVINYRQQLAAMVAEVDHYMYWLDIDWQQRKATILQAMREVKPCKWEPCKMERNMEIFYKIPPPNWSSILQEYTSRIV